ncbi:M48 family metallopeptidase [Candidatus Gracilibacteria bacterium]|nr:M48 family metallopeptidase [Candidatus Gracilibacteria bacterium]
MNTCHIKVTKSIRKSLTMRFDKYGVLQVKAPFFVTKKQIDIFLDKNTAWIEKYHEIAKQKILPESEVEILKQKAKAYIPQRVEYFAKKYGFKYEKIRITCARTRWGSCSSRKTLSFSYRLMQYRDECIDYVIIHELCHLRQMNHSQKFWSEVRAIMPEYKKWEKELKGVKENIL